MENPNDQDLLNIGQEMIENYKDRLPNENLDATIENVVENQDHQLEFFSVLNSNLVSYAEFYENFILANRPCLLETTADMYDWEAVQNWCIKSDTEANSEAVDDSKKQHCSLEVINVEYLSLQFGSCSVSVTNCDNILQNYEESKCEMMSLSDYLHYLLDYRSKRYPASMPCLYLKDWHLMRQIEENLVESIIPYKIPKYFASDWLNETSKEQGDDFRFIYIGPKGSWTPFHSDVYGSYSWSANVIGIKKWFLYPPGKEERFRRSGNMFKFDFQNPGVENFDYYEVIQKKGQVIFVPSGWYHIVWNLEDTISINHNWMNAANVGYIWSNLKKALIEVKKELEDLKDLIDFREICQNLLKANHGMDYTIFIKILSTVFENRRNGLSYTSSYHFTSNHKKFDIMILKNLFNEMKHDEEVRELLSGSECQVLHEAWSKFENLSNNL